MFNPKTSGSRSDFFALVDRYCAGTLDEESSRRLVALLESDTTHKRGFVEYVDLHTELYEQVGIVPTDFDIPKLLSVLDTSGDDLKRLTRRHVVMAAVSSSLLCTLVFLVCGWLWMEHYYHFGTVQAVSGGDLIFREESRVASDPLGYGRVVLDSGAASIRLNDKVCFLMEAKTEVELVSRHVLRLLKGQISVESAGGNVEILAGKQRLVNLGTSFTVRLDEDKQAQVHVLEGAVLAGSPGPAPNSELTSRIDAGQAMLFEQGAAPVAVTFNRSVFISAQEFTQAISENIQTPVIHEVTEHERNRAAGLVLRHSFEELNEDSKFSINQAEGAWDFGTGRITGATPVPGRSPGSTALRFRGKNFQDRVEFSMEDSVVFDAGRPMTLIVWFRTPGLDHGDARLVSRGIDESLSWNVWWRGADDVFGIGYQSVGDKPHVVEHWDFQDGAWHQVAVSWEPAEPGRSTISLYFDGVFIKQHENVAVRSTDAVLMIGNCVDARGHYRSFLGDIDDVSLFDRTLSPDEIALDYKK